MLKSQSCMQISSIALEVNWYNTFTYMFISEKFQIWTPYKPSQQRLYIFFHRLEGFRVAASRPHNLEMLKTDHFKCLCNSPSGTKFIYIKRQYVYSAAEVGSI